MTAAFDHQILDPAQACLRLRTDLIVTPHDNATFIIEDPLSGKYFLVGASEWSFLSQIDGTCTIAEAIGLAATEAPQGAALTEREGISVARWLVDQGLAKPVDMLLGGQADDAPAAPAAPFNPLMLRCGSFNPDSLLGAVDARLGWLWSKPFLVLWFCLFTAAAYKLCTNWTQWNALPTQIFDRHNWLRMGIVWTLLKLLHEFGHGLSCKHFGVPVRRAGLLLIFFAPVPYVDVSGAWRISLRSRRIAISAAGMYLELLVAFVAVLLWNPTSLELFDRICVDIVILAGFNTLAFNANPLMRFDGYYILADAIGIPNLAGESRRYLSNFVRFWLRGIDVPGMNASPFNRVVIKSYSYASFGWRCLTFAGIAVSLIARWSWWGAAASLVVGWFWFGITLPNSRRQKDVPSRSTKGIRRRRAAFAALGFAAFLVVAWLASPAQVSAPAVVEYAPLTVVRASADGFVKNVYVREGDEVDAGALLLELTNDDLASNVKRLEVELEQARLRSRAFLNQNDFSKQQQELAVVVSLESQLLEFRAQLEGLRVRAPRRSTIASDGLAGLLGCYVGQGDVLVLLGAEDCKELLVSALSTDEDKFASHLGESVSIERPYGQSSSVTGQLVNVEPRFSDSLPHHALGADSGGDVAVRLDHRSRSNYVDEDHSPSITPRIVATVRLDADVSRRLRAGQRAIVTLSGTYESRGGQILKRWNEYLLEFSSHTASAPAASGVN